MAELVITDLIKDTDSRVLLVQFGETIAAFDTIQVVGNKFVNSIASDPLKDFPTHMALESGVLNEFKTAVLLEGIMNLTTSVPLVQGQQYVQANTAGKISLQSDLVTADGITYVFIGDAGLLAQVNRSKTGIPVP